MTRRDPTFVRSLIAMRARILPAMLAAVLVCGIAGIPASSPASPVAAVAAAPFAPATFISGDLARRRCASCGRVLAIRHVEATATEDESFEFTVRMYGGAVHTSSSDSIGPWRVGDRIILIGAGTGDGVTP